jgi:hypothetical protein
VGETKTRGERVTVPLEARKATLLEDASIFATGVEEVLDRQKGVERSLDEELSA